MAGMREKRREGCSEGEVEVSGKFNQDASFIPGPGLTHPCYPAHGLV